jgi:PAP2 superfamily
MSFTPPGAIHKRQANSSSSDQSATGAALVQADEVMSDGAPPAPPPPPPSRAASARGKKSSAKAVTGPCVPEAIDAKDDRLLALAPEVRLMLCIRELQARLMVGGKKSKATVNVLAADEPATIATIAPPTLDTLKNEVFKVVEAAKLRKDNIDSIVAHHLELDRFFMDVLRLDPDLYRRVGELIVVTAAVVESVVQRLKYLFDVPRPTELEPKLTTAVLVPRHSSYPGGHAAQSHAVARVLASLCSPRVPNRLDKLADFIGDNRVVAGLHYPLDTSAGAALGKLLGDLIVALIADEDLTVTTLNIGAGAVTSGRSLVVTAHAPLLRRLAQAARDELADKTPLLP